MVVALRVVWIILALGTMSNVFTKKGLVLSIQAVCSSRAVLVIQSKHRFLLDTLPSLIGNVLVILSKHIIDLGVQVMLVEK